MFGLFKREAVLERAVVEPPAPPRPSAVPVPQTDDAEHRVYVETATRLGVVNAAVKREMVLHLAQEMGLRLYDRRAVEAYLDSVFGRPERTYHGSWGWRPLRQLDADRKLRFAEFDGWRNGNILAGIYHGAVPLPVLLTVERLASHVPDLQFYISDKNDSPKYTEDPFLMVLSEGMDPLIIERWDEPSFRA